MPSILIFLSLLENLFAAIKKSYYLRIIFPLKRFVLFCYPFGIRLVSGFYPFAIQFFCFPFAIRSGSDKDSNHAVESKFLQKIIDQIESEIVLVFPDISQKFMMECDASEIGFGCILKQSHGIVGFFSKKFSKSENNYSIVEKEFLAIKEGLKNWEKIVLCCEIEIRTDNKALLNFENINSNRISRWNWIFEEFNFKIVHVKSELNHIADTLSRNCNIKIVKQKTNEIIFKELIESLSNENQESNQKEILLKLHELLGHPGPRNSSKLLKNYIGKSFNNLNQSISLNCFKCLTCKHRNMKRELTNGKLFSKIPGADLATDIYGPYKFKYKDTYKKIYFVSFLDICTRYTETIGIKDIKAETVTNAFNKGWIEKHGKPKTILCDHDTQYTSNIFQNYCEEREIKIKYATVNNPQGNASVERIHRSINEIMRIFHKEKRMKELEKLIYLRLNVMMNRNTGEAPFTLFHKRKFGNENFIREYDLVLKRANNFSQLNKNIRKPDKSKGKMLSIKKGDKILIKNKVNLKQDPLWKGPYEVAHVGEHHIEFQNGIIREKVSKKNVQAVQEGG